MIVVCSQDWQFKSLQGFSQFWTDNLQTSDRVLQPVGEGLWSGFLQLGKRLSPLLSGRSRPTRYGFLALAVLSAVVAAPATAPCSGQQRTAEHFEAAEDVSVASPPPKFPLSCSEEAFRGRRLPLSKGQGMNIPEGYEPLHLLREGPNSIVWRAKRLADATPVALKILSPNVDGDVMEANEARTLSSLPNKYIAQLTDFGALDGGRMFIVTELMSHGTLRERLRTGPCSSKETLRIAYQVARGLLAAHSARILHLDVKPSNVGITGPNGDTAKLLDFGSAVRGRRRALVGLSQGTPIYCSPEQARGNHTRPSADVYSLGCVLYEMAEGRPPFVENSIEGYLYAHLAEIPPRMVSQLFGRYQPDLEWLVGSMLQKRQALRPTIARVVQVLTLIREGRPVEHLRAGPTVWEEPYLRPRRHAAELAKMWESRW